VPVRTTEGSWIAWILAGGAAIGGAFAIGYAKKAGEKMAEAGFKDIGFKDVFKKSVHALQTLVKLVKHTQAFRGWDLRNGLVKADSSEVGLVNAKGELIYVPIEYLRWYVSLPPNVVSKLTHSVSETRVLTIGVQHDGYVEEESVTTQEKTLFDESADAVDEDVLFPEFEHGDEVSLRGKLTRGNANSNSLGLEYEGTF
jgi:hypothetical protein